ncbi:tetratricopeptide repeat protein [Streptomyces sp. I05A-00742]|uniref:tetratricopeptide repeat protein n=1 Tax=Streptomyces sp. I05A-00742 TaxID=2732853 RepID=UPI0014879E12|nr:tetratricopeptide repeat protein [Streptomyces sp. I05A-00742]
MASPHASPSPRPPRPNTAFRELRGPRSPGEFAAAVRRAAREIGEQVACDARYIGRVESGEIRCPNYAYERVFRHMFPGLEPADMGFPPRETVRGRGARKKGGAPSAHTESPADACDDAGPGTSGPGYVGTSDTGGISDEESDVLRRAFMTHGTAAVAVVSLGGVAGARPQRHAGEAEAAAVEQAVRRIRLLDDRHGADSLYRRAGRPLRAAYDLLDAETRRQSVADRLHTGAGELAISVGWLAHDSGRFSDARSHYAEALATARVAGDPALEAHAFCNTAFLARDAGRPREAVRAAQAAQHAGRRLGSARLMSLLALREAGGWARLGDRAACEGALLRARTLFGRGAGDADPEWMTFFGEAELEGLEAQCWSALGDRTRAAEHGERAVALADPHFARNIALYTAQLADDLAGGGAPDAAAAAAGRVLDLLTQVQSSRIRAMLAATARTLRPRTDAPGVASFLERHDAARLSA